MPGVRWLTHTGREVSPSGLKIDASASGNKRGGVAPGSGGLRTPAEKCRPPGLKTEAGASGKKRGGGAGVRWLTHTGIGTTGVRKPPDREHASLLLSPEGDT